MDAETARLGRAVRKLQVAVALLGSAVVALGGYAAWLTTRIDEDPPGGWSSFEQGGVDVHAAFTPGSSAVVRTEAGLRVSVTLAEFTTSTCGHTVGPSSLIVVSIVTSSISTGPAQSRTSIAVVTE